MARDRPEALADQIVELARRGIIPTPFGVSDIRPHVRGFAPTHINTVLANYECNGDQVRRGRRPRFRRVSLGRYEPA